jgi:beta-phosphoglucomutase-like phosphatase (HAD superfamily)|tara:strand:+ start:322 stop:696 length:375 start_codon:yes stop_codon:yes gene_type:complete
MAKGKSGSGVKKVSAGGTTGRPSRKITNAIKRDRRNFVLVDMQTIRSMTAREDFYRELAKRRDQKSKDQYAKYLEKQSVINEAEKLYKKYKRAGCTYGACVQAVKTNWVSDFTQKWNQQVGGTA